MFRYLVAWLPTFRLERCGWSIDQRVVLVEEDRSALRVQCATPPVLTAGVRPGMTLAESCALAPDLLVERRVAEEESADLSEVADQLLRISPAVAPLPPTGLVAEVGRSERASVGQERALVERVRNRLAVLGHPARVVIADDPDTARILAAFGDGDRVIVSGEGAAALAPLPLHALELPEQEETLLGSLGIHTIGALAALDAASVVGRLGPVGVLAHALAQGRGRRPVLSPWKEDGTLTLTQELPDPVVQLEALLFIINALLRDACARLRPQARAATRVVLHLRLEGGGQQHLSVRLGRPSRDPTSILALLRERMERVQLTAPVDALTLELPEASPFDGRQHDLLQRHRAAEALADVSARLQDTLGGCAVFRARLVDAHRPETAWQPSSLELAAPPRPRPPVPWTALAPATRPLPAHPPVDDPVEAWCGNPDRPPPDRPPILLCPAQVARVRTGTGGRPVRLELDGRWLDVARAEGPERLCGEWWDRSFQRDYWRANLQDGRRAWIYREEGHWLVHGWWDRP